MHLVGFITVLTQQSSPSWPAAVPFSKPWARQCNFRLPWYLKDGTKWRWMHPWMNDVNDGCLKTGERSAEKVTKVPRVGIVVTTFVTPAVCYNQWGTRWLYRWLCRWVLLTSSVSLSLLDTSREEDSYLEIWTSLRSLFSLGQETINHMLLHHFEGVFNYETIKLNFKLWN